MKLKFEFPERRFISYQLYQLAIEAGQTGERKLYRELVAMANQFSDNSLVSNMKQHQAALLMDLTNSTIKQLEEELIPRIEKENKSDKEETLKKANEILVSAKKVIKVLKHNYGDTLSV